MSRLVNPQASSRGISSLSKAALGRRQTVSQTGKAIMDAEFAAKCEAVVRVRCACPHVASWLVKGSDVGPSCWTCGSTFVEVTAS